MASNSLTEVGGGWLGADLANDPSRWTVEMPPAVGAELMELAARRAGRAPALDDSAPKVSPATAAFVSGLRELFMSGRYFGVVSGFPHEPFHTAQDAYWLLGLLLGAPVPQNPRGTLIVRVEELEPAKRRARGPESAARLPFHSDGGDLITMLCIRPAASGGVTRLVSARALHDLLLAESPHLLPELYRPLPFPLPPDLEAKYEAAGGRRDGEEMPWPALPVFGFAANGEFSAWYSRWHLEASQRQAGAPRPTAGQLAAMDVLDEIAARPEVPLDIDLRPGQVLLFNNAELLHARSAFESGPQGEGRLLLRLWLCFAGSQELPDDYRDVYGATEGGSYRGGVWPVDDRPGRLGLPVRAEGSRPRAS
ncbi:MAG TPA: TauD/TfdA family dioxygenase [Streptosporangiaceae bacterium]|nr:TauD/TfdA family dioxygenase [Streptosporangiaceae bacterium]